MNQFEMVILIVAIVMFASVMRARYSGRYSGRRRELEGAEDPDALRLKEEVRMLKERIAVLERIATDKESTLEREIERLRDH